MLIMTTCPLLQLLLIYDIYEGICSQFDTFWSYLEMMLQDYCEAAADNRRLSLASCNFHSGSPEKSNWQDTYRIKEHHSSPIRWTYTAPVILPMNKHAQSSMKFTKWFNIRSKVQQRSLRLNHKDSHCTTLFKYLKHICVQYRDHTFLLSCDDKLHIQVGEPKHAVAALDRGRRVLGHEVIPIVALDHDFKITPSISLVVDIPSSPCWKDYVATQFCITESSSRKVPYVTRAWKSLEIMLFNGQNSWYSWKKFRSSICTC